MDEKLEVCPLCGGEAELKQGFYVIDNYVGCLKCGTRTAYYQTKAAAIKRWNTRKPIDRIVEQLEAEKYRGMEGLEPIKIAFNFGINKALDLLKGVQNE